MNCSFSKFKNVFRCDVCGYVVKKPRPIPPKKNCKDTMSRRRQRRGLGDWVAWLLSLVGITKRRAQAVARAVGRESCGCAERQEKLNELGDAITGEHRRHG